MMDRRPLQRLSYGMYIVCAREEDRINGQLSNTVFQTASDPPIVSVCINRKNVTHGMIERSGLFSVSVLDVSAPFSLIAGFGFRHGGDVDKFLQIPHQSGSTGLPIVTSNTNAFLEARVIGSIQAATHTVFLGLVTNAGSLGEGASMTYDHYRTVLKGLTPKDAPTYSPAGG